MEEEDVRAIVRLLGEVAVLDGTPGDKRFAVMDGLKELIDADAWVWSVTSPTNPGDHPAYSIFLKDGFTEAAFARYLDALEHPDMGHLTAPFFEDLNKSGSHTTRLRQQIDPSDSFQRSEALPVWRNAGVGPLILSARPTSDGELSLIGLYRKFDRDLFSERESRIAHIILSEVAWLHDNALPGHCSKDGIIGLSPRLRQVLNLLLQGTTRKEIASDLGISVHTLNAYIKDIYSRFRVHSHPELLRRFFVGDGGDLPAHSGEN